MAKRKNQSFVKINENKKIKEEILNPLKQYEYIEPKKKLPLKKLILFFFTIILIFLILLLANIVSKEIKTEKKKIQNTTTTNNFFTMKNTTTTTTTTTTTYSNNINSNEITETLTCSKTTEKDGLLYTESIITEYNNKKLRNDITSINIRQITDDSTQTFKDQLFLYEIMSSYLDDEKNCEITNKIEEKEYQLNIKTLYHENETVKGLFSYNYDYDKALKELITLGYECK